jgi:16S rRNA (uracil1498-N3)-methyltransferase
MPRFPLPQEPDDQGQVILSGPDATHIAGSLRLRAGDRLPASRPGRLLELEITHASASEIAATVLYDVPEPDAPRVELTLLVALPKKRLMESIIEKASEIGVRALQPVIAERCIAKLEGERSEARLAKWRRVAEESQKQCGRTVPLIVEPPLPLEHAVRGDWMRLYVLHESAKAPLTSGDAPSEGGIAALIGPEGGLSPAEVRLAGHAGGLVRRLNTNILKVDTAASVAAAILIAAPWSGGAR